MKKRHDGCGSAKSHHYKNVRQSKPRFLLFFFVLSLFPYYLTTRPLSVVISYLSRREPVAGAKGGQSGKQAGIAGSVPGGYVEQDVVGQMHC